MTARQFSHAELVAGLEALLRSGHAPERPVWYLDQQRAAADDAGRLFRACSTQMRDLKPEAAFRNIAEQVDPAAVAQWVAAIVRCRWCPHMRNGEALQPAIVDLNHRRASCIRCAKTFRKPIDDDRCEVCDTTGHTTFRPALVQIGGVIVTAEIGPCCWHLLPEAGDGE